MTMGSTNTTKQCEDYTLLPIHEHSSLMDKTCVLLNEEWPRSVTARMRTLLASCDEFPVCLVLVERCRPGSVVGHAKLSPVPDRDDALFVESVIISLKLRGRGLGRHLMDLVERYAASRGCQQLYLTTHDQQQFYARLGYTFCAPVQTFGGSRRLLNTAGGSSQRSNSPVQRPITNGLSVTAPPSPQTQSPGDGGVGRDTAGTGPPPPPPPPPPSSQSPLSPPPPPPPPGKWSSAQKEQPKKDFMMKML